MLKYLWLGVLLPSLITATTVKCSGGKVTCPEGKQCCTVDGHYECCESQIPGLESVEEPRLAAARYGNFRNSSMTVQNGLSFGSCNYMTCSGTCCSADGCCPMVNAACCQDNRCCRSGQVCCPTGCCEGGHTCCGDGCCSILNHCCPGSNICCRTGNVCCGSACCLPGSTCCSDGHCCPNGGTCCPNGRCCSKGKVCCGDGCCSVGSSCCGGDKCCPSGAKCCNGEWCCKNSQRCSWIPHKCLATGMTLVSSITLLVAMFVVSITSKFSII